MQALNPYYAAGAGSKVGHEQGCQACMGLDRAAPSRFWKDAPSKEILEELGSLDNGFAVLKARAGDCKTDGELHLGAMQAAIAILNRHYPGIIGKVFYLNSVLALGASETLFVAEDWGTALTSCPGHGFLGGIQNLLPLDR